MLSLVTTLARSHKSVLDRQHDRGHDIPIPLHDLIPSLAYDGSHETGRSRTLRGPCPRPPPPSARTRSFMLRPYTVVRTVRQPVARHVCMHGPTSFNPAFALAAAITALAATCASAAFMTDRMRRDGRALCVVPALSSLVLTSESQPSRTLWTAQLRKVREQARRWWYSA